MLIFVLIFARFGDCD